MDTDLFGFFFFVFFVLRLGVTVGSDLVRGVTIIVYIRGLSLIAP